MAHATTVATIWYRLKAKKWSPVTLPLTLCLTMIMSPRGINIFRILAYQRSLCLLYRIVAWHQVKIVAQAQLWNCLTGQKQKLGDKRIVFTLKHATFVYSELFLVFFIRIRIELQYFTNCLESNNSYITLKKLNKG